ncbi:lysophospholipase L1-like esterase [Rhizobium sp. BK529]|nr:lysophospholipase L1-like esterase [Rhizobium sp. BK529]
MIGNKVASRMRGVLLGVAIMFGAHDVMASASELKIVSFGTSLTDVGGWQPSLQRQLSSCLGREVKVTKVAMSGATSYWAKTHLDRVVAERPDIVLVEFYANDATLHRFVSVAASRTNMAYILDELRKRLPDARIIVMAMNPFSGIRGAIRPFVDDYIEAHKQEAQNRHLEFVDFRGLWMQLAPAERERAIPDGAHPKPEAASQIIVPELVNRISGSACKQ